MADMGTVTLRDVSGKTWNLSTLRPGHRGLRETSQGAVPSTERPCSARNRSAQAFENSPRATAAT